MASTGEEPYEAEYEDEYEDGDEDAAAGEGEDGAKDDGHQDDAEAHPKASESTSKGGKGKKRPRHDTWSSMLTTAKAKASVGVGSEDSYRNRRGWKNKCMRLCEAVDSEDYVGARNLAAAY